MNATISIARAGQELGAWGAADIHKMLQAGVLTPADHFWQEGMPEWVTLEGFVPPRPATMIFPVTFGNMWSVDKVGFVGKGELHLTPDIMELVGRCHWPGAARLGVFVAAAPLAWWVFGSIIRRLPADTDPARFLYFCAVLFTVLGVPLLVLTLMHYLCASWVKMRWSHTMVSNVRRSGRVLTFELPVAGSSRPRTAVVCAADEATAGMIEHDLPGSTISASCAVSGTVAPAESAVPVAFDPSLLVEPHQHLLARCMACFADVLISIGGFMLMFVVVAFSPGYKPFSQRRLTDGFGGNMAVVHFVALVALAAGLAYFLFRDGLPCGSFGKRFVGLTVIDRWNRSRCSYWKSLVRNLVLVIPYAVCVEFLRLLFSPKGKRLGDLLAGTQVVRMEAAITHARGPLQQDRSEEIADPLSAHISALPSDGSVVATVRVFDGNTHLHGLQAAERLTALNSLRDQGLISDEIFETKHQQILQEL